MNGFDLISYSVSNLRRRKGRTALTIVGVIVGVCAIVVMISLGIAVNEATDDMLNSWGDLTRIEVYNHGAAPGTDGLDDKTVMSFQSLPNVLTATPIYRPSDFTGELSAGINGKYQAPASIVALYPDSVDYMGYSILTGNTQIAEPLANRRIPVVIGEQMFFRFYDSSRSLDSPGSQIFPQYSDDYTSIINLPVYENGVFINADDFFFDPMNTEITLKIQYDKKKDSDEEHFIEYILIPVGVISGGTQNEQVSESVIMSIDNVMLIEKEYKLVLSNSGESVSQTEQRAVIETGTVSGYQTVFVKVDHFDHMEETELEIKKRGYRIGSLVETRHQLSGQVAQTQMMLGALAAISLIVAAINIMNTMTTAIYERTREIGVMKVLGCELNSIRQLFLIEAGIIGFVGGCIGVIVSSLISLLLNNLTQIFITFGIETTFDMARIFGLSGFAESMAGMKLSITPPWLLITALFFSTTVGILSGISPANRAVRISSLEAIRHE